MIVHNNMENEQAKYEPLLSEGENDTSEPSKQRTACGTALKIAKQMNLFVMLLLFLVSGVVTPTLVDTLKHAGAAGKQTFLYLAPNYVAMATLLFIPTDMGILQLGLKRVAVCSAVALVDVISQALAYYGLVLCGSGPHSVAYSSVTVFTAILSRFIVNKKLNWPQWTGVLLVTGGLALNGYSSKSDKDLLLGVLLVLAGSFLHALTYVLDEKLMKGSMEVPPTKLAGIFGFVGGLAIAAYIGAFVVPHWDTMVADPVRENGEPLWKILTLYGALFMSYIIHAFCFFLFLGSVGSVTTGVLKGLQAIILFFWGGLVMCRTEKSQCINMTKTIAMFIVVTGVIVYSVGKSLPKKKSSKVLAEERSVLVRAEENV